MIDPKKIQKIRDAVREVPDFPKKGILFKDLTTVFKDPGLIDIITEALVGYYSAKGITKVAGIEARGFIIGSILARELNAGFIPVRKPGKLPAETHSVQYELEYGIDTIEIHRDAISSEDVVLLHDDLLATGGTAQAAVELIRKSNPQKIYVNFLVELSFLQGVDKLDKEMDLFSLITF